MLTIILSGVGGSANWMAFLLPFVLLIIIIKGGPWLYNRIRAYLVPKLFKKKRHSESFNTGEENKTFSLS